MFRKIRYPFSFFNILVTENPIKMKFSAFVAEKTQSQNFSTNRVPAPPGNSWNIYWKISRTLKVLENDLGPGKSWKSICKVLESPGICWTVMQTANAMMQTQMSKYGINLCLCRQCLHSSLTLVASVNSASMCICTPLIHIVLLLYCINGFLLYLNIAGLWQGPGKKHSCGPGKFLEFFVTNSVGTLYKILPFIKYSLLAIR